MPLKMGGNQPGDTKSLLSNLKAAKLSRYLVYFFSGLTFIYVSYLAIYYIFLDFDGALHSQTAINFYKIGKFIHDYKAHEILAIGFPFQILNGLLFKIFGIHFSTAGLTNALFYALFFWFSFRMSKRSGSKFPLISFIVCSFSFGLLRYGFAGYGEMPALIIGLFGVYLMIFYRNSHRHLFFGAFLIALSVSIKWVMLLLVGPLFFIALILIWKREYKAVILGILVFGVTLALLQIYYFLSLGSFSLGELANKILYYHNLSSSGQNGFVDYFNQRIAIFKQTYFGTPEAFSKQLASLKVLMYFWVFFVAGRILYKQFKSFIDRKSENKSKFDIDNLDMYFLFLSIFAVVYFAWWWVLQTITQPWFRRVFNADILLFLSFSLIPYIYYKYFRKHYLWVKYITIVILLIFVSVNIYNHFYKKIGYEQWIINNVKFEEQFKKGLKLLPEDYRGYGIGWYSAPRWSFVAQKKFYDLMEWETSFPSMLYHYFDKKSNDFIFYENVTPQSYLDQVSLIYNVENIYSFGQFGILKVNGFNTKTPTYVETIDFEKDSYDNSVRGFNEWKQNMYRCSQFDSAVFLDNTRNFKNISLRFNNPVFYRIKNLKVGFVSKDNLKKFVAEIKIRHGDNTVYLTIPDELRGSKFGLYLLLAPYQEPHTIERGLKFVKIALSNETGNASFEKRVIYSEKYRGKIEVFSNISSSSTNIINFGDKFYYEKQILGFYQDKWVSNSAEVLLKATPSDKYLILEGIIPTLSYRGKENLIEIWYLDEKGRDKLLIKRSIKTPGGFTIKSPIIPPEFYDNEVIIKIKGSEYIKPITSPDYRNLSFLFKSLYFSSN